MVGTSCVAPSVNTREFNKHPRLFFRVLEYNPDPRQQQTLRTSTTSRRAGQQSLPTPPKTNTVRTKGGLAYNEQVNRINMYRLLFHGFMRMFKWKTPNFGFSVNEGIQHHKRLELLFSLE